MKGKEPASYIQEYYEIIKAKYPHLSYNQIDEICRTNFRMVKAEMKKGSLQTIRLKYFGTFRVNRGRAIGLLNKTRKMFRQEKIKEPTLEYVTDIVEAFLKREYDEDLPPEKISET